MANLYPPIIDTYMPAFIILQDKDKSETYCDIYFSISEFNSINEIESVWLSVTNQYTNVSVLNSEIYKTQLKRINMSDVSIDNSRPGNDKYKIRLYGNELKEGWRIDEVYKIQLRFCSNGIVKNEMSDIIKNQSFFSEWSTVCLIQGILKPTINFVNFNVLPGMETVLTSIGNSIVGNFDFQNTDTLESYRIQLAEVDKPNNILLDSGILYTEIFNPNEINYIIKYEFKENVKYFLRFDYTTSKLYEGTQSFYFTIINSNAEAFQAQITTEPENEFGRIKIHAFSETENMFGNLVIRRASNKTNFTMWEDVHITSIIDNKPLNYTWYDYSVESGVWYLYCIQKVNNIGGRGVVIKAEKPVMILLEDMFLVGSNKQLKIKFNPQINSFTHTVMDSSTQTIGSKYPFVKRNAYVNYRQFSISGLISHFCDEYSLFSSNSCSELPKREHLFTSKEELYGEHLNKYVEYNQEHDITDYNDFTYERDFRNLVNEFLYDGKTKLFKSAPEGNILVRLMNVSLTPEKTLGRMIYSFSATAYEIGENSIENLDKYEIQTIGSYVNKAIRQYTGSRNAFNVETLNNTNLIKILQEKESALNTEETTRQIESITDLIIQLDTSYAYPVDLDNMTVNGSSENTALGFLVEINGIKYFINSNGYYKIEDTEILEFLVYAPEDVVFQTEVLKCKYKANETENIDLTTYKESYYSKIGQYADTVDSDINIVERIRAKYDRIYNTINYERVTNIANILIAAPEGTVFKIGFGALGEEDNNLYEHIIGNTGILDFQNNNYSINQIYVTENSVPIVIDYRYDLEKGLLEDE